MSALTSADYTTLAQERGFRWLGPLPRDTRAKTRWRCPHGHVWQTRYGHIRDGRGCPDCAHTRPKTIADYRRLAKKRGFRWQGATLPPNTNTPTQWECRQGHQWAAQYQSLANGYGCPRCARLARARHDPKEYRALARKYHFTWVGPEVPNGYTVTTWQCRKGHQWEAPFFNVQAGHGCPDCFRIAHSIHEPKVYRALARQRGWRWLGPPVPHSRAPTTWQCRQGHQWQAPFCRVSRGQGCPDCAGNRRKTPADFRALARARHFKWLGPEAPNNNTPTQWQCSLGHIWRTAYRRIQQGDGCPECARAPERRRPIATKRLPKPRPLRT